LLYGSRTGRSGPESIWRSGGQIAVAALDPSSGPAASRTGGRVAIAAEPAGRRSTERFVIGDSDSSGNARAVASDEVLVRATLDGDAAAFTLLVRRYLRKAMAVAMELAVTREDAEDIVQDTFRRAFEALRSFDAARRFSPWFFTILRNTARNAAKKRRVRDHEEIPHDHAARGPGPYEDSRREELRRRIAEAIESLTPRQRTCFRLCLVEGLSNTEAAHATGLAESTVRVHVFNARRALQALLAGWRDEVRNA